MAISATLSLWGLYQIDPTVLDLLQLPDEEIEEIAKLTDKVRDMQELLLYGTFFRLKSPYEGNQTAWMCVSEDKKEAVVTHVFTLGQPNPKDVRLTLRGLDPALDYQDVETGAVYGGDELMLYGVVVKKPHGDYTAQQFHFKAI